MIEQTGRSAVAENAICIVPLKTVARRTSEVDVTFIASEVSAL